MLTALTFAVLLQIPAPAVDQLRASGYEYISDKTTESTIGGAIWDYEFRNEILKSRVVLKIGPTTLSNAAKGVENYDRLSQRLTAERGSPSRLSSGLPLGLYLRADSGSGTVIVLAYGDSAMLELRLFAYASKAHGTTVWEQFDPERDKAVCEGIARWTLAGESAKRYATTTATLGGRNYTARKSPRGAIQVVARDWASANGYTLSLNKSMGRAQLSGPRGTILIPLGADRVKVNDNWVRFDGIVGAIGDQPLLPVAGIQALMGGG
jgi:hypothetical protein